MHGLQDTETRGRQQSRSIWGSSIFREPTNERKGLSTCDGYTSSRSNSTDTTSSNTHLPGKYWNKGQRIP